MVLLSKLLNYLKGKQAVYSDSCSLFLSLYFYVEIQIPLFQSFLLIYFSKKGNIGNELFSW